MPDSVPPIEPAPEPTGGDRVDRLESRLDQVAADQADLIAAQRANTEAMAQVSQNLATLNERLARPEPPPTPGTPAAPQEPPAAVQNQPVPAPPVPADRVEPSRRRRYA